MAYRNGTYIAFHAGGTTDPTASDIKYYRMMKAWHAHDDIEFSFINSTKETLRRSLLARLANSKNMVVIIGPTTKNDTDWVPFEIARAIDDYGLPVIAVYTGYDRILNPQALSSAWPAALSSRITSRKARVIHISFKQVMVDMAIRQFNLNSMPQDALTCYTAETYERAGIRVR